MEISSRDNSSGAEIARLKAEQTAMQERLAKLEPPPKEPKVDLKAERAEQAERTKAIADLKTRLEQRHKRLKSIDRLVEQMITAITDERSIRQGLLAEHGRVIGKETRREIDNDNRLLGSLRRKIDDALRPHSTAHEISFERVADEDALKILQKLEGEEIDAILS